MKLNFSNKFTYFFIFFIILAGFVFAGSLTPSTNTSTSTMYTVNDFYNLIVNNSTTTTGVHTVSTTTTPIATSSHSISEIYARLANLIKKDKLKTGTTYLGVTGDYGVTDEREDVPIIYSLLSTTSDPTSSGYTLEDIYNLITNNATTTAGSHSFSTTSSPVSSMYSLSSLYTSLSSLIIANTVATGTTYLGVTGTYVLPCPATGGTLTEVGNYCINTFTEDGEFVVPSGSINADVLVVAGGGAGGSGTGGGGGAGGLKYTNMTVSGSSDIQVGDGGVYSNGEDSYFGDIVATGGGMGGGNGGPPGFDGGSGGGGGSDGSGPPHGNGISGQGSDGGDGNTVGDGGGGGGGAGEVGVTALNYQGGGNGGDGLPYDISGVTTYYAGGGGGGYYAPYGGSAGHGGLGGGGDGGGAGFGGTSGSAGTPNTGGGGGNGGPNFDTYSGGSGIVIVRYLKSGISVSSIAIKTPATKLSYYVDESLDVSGLTLTVTYSDNSTSTETVYSSNVTGFNSSTPAEDQTLTITFGTKTTTYTVDIVEVPIDLGLGLVAHYKMNDNLGTAAVIDSIGSNNGTAQQFTNVLTTSKVDKALSFNGTSDNIIIPAGSNLITGTNDFTISGWIKTSSNLWIANLFTFMAWDGQNQTDVQFFITSTNISIWAVSGFLFQFEHGVDVSGWHHYAFTRSGNTWKAYVDGSQVGEDVTDTRSLNYVYPGSYYNIGSSQQVLQLFVGSIDDERIYNRALTQTDINSIYNSGAGTESQAGDLGTGLVAHYKMNDNLATKAVVDNAGTNTGTSIRDTSEMTSAKIDRALSFNGSSDYIEIVDAAPLQISTAISVSAWIKTSSVSLILPIAKWKETTDQRAWAMAIDSGTIHWSLDSSGTGSGYQNLASIATVNDGEWNHVVATFDSADSGRMKIYINGELDNSQTTALASLFVGDNPLTIGTSQFAGNSVYFDGSLDDVRIYNHALTQSDIDAIYNSDLGTEGE